MLKRAAASLLSPKKAKKARTGNQQTIRSYFASSSTAKSGRKTGSQPVVVDLCSSDEHEDEKNPSPSSVSVKDRLDNKLSSLPNGASSKVKPNPIKPVDPNANPLRSTPNLSIDPLDFSLLPCPWDTDSPAPYAFLAHTLVTLSSTRSRISITNTLVNTLRLLIRYDARRSLLPALYLLSNSLAPSYEDVELKIGPSTVSKAIQSVSGISSEALRSMFQKLGDPGDVAFTAKSSLRTLRPVPPLQLASVHANLLKISGVKGETSTKKKQSIIEKLLVAARGEEVRYLVRMLSLNLRVGAVRKSIVSALGRALVLTPPNGEEPKELSEPREKEEGKKKAKSKSKNDALEQKMADAEALMKQVYVRHPNFGHIVDVALQLGLEGLSDGVQLTVGIPLHPTLGSPTRSLDEIYDRLGDLPFTAEFKYDGQRVQVHAFRDTAKIAVRLFSRNLEDTTQMYPDIVHMAQTIMARSKALNSFILDAEIVAVDPHTGAIRKFQELSNRPRKGVNLTDVKVVVCVYAFDLMYLNGEVLLEKPFRERRRLLREWFPRLVPKDPLCSRLAHAESVESEDGREAVEEFWERAVASQSEGLMIKLLDSGEVVEAVEETDGPRKKENKRKKKPLTATYEPDKRTSTWLKLKKDYVNGLGDSLDLVPIGGWHGIGRKAGWWSPILLGLWDAKAGQFLGVCKCMSGFSDSFYKALNERYSEEAGTCSKSPYADVNASGLVPPVWFKPSEVWEIKGADITLSPISQASKGLVAGDRGLSLRFPRFIRVRKDKALNDASTPEFLASLWRKQEGKGGGADEGDLVDASSEEELSEKDELE
ncbi:DNA ligase 1 [Rhizoctonia solani]|uniref:DNA ligase n=1 Tax=Rhizoctonia solani TaxID=456999 RepID=A0A0K6GI56_9AGAM|nr:DNA ligase 1 [Rhizoctonia solani]